MVFYPTSYEECEDTDCRYCWYINTHYLNDNGFAQCPIRDKFRDVRNESRMEMD